ncbi:helix-hairpin-helix domain-containing protein [Flavobacterium sp. SM15]|uniref:ComEA family DNA-binding protein n=1 Tax=Flavobacterium sp. SM15 TaxID=2908005 RepID=UPI001EDBA939|nr:helix-hairpin-helix domain-containing protein [Flavobacterium sp. SM15]MCG2610598.1 helix-hairpin-helix domain-containing protein [Flavobacterium sp. SM15]
MKNNGLSVQFTREQRGGVFALLLLMLFTQVVYCFCFSNSVFTKEEDSESEKEWLSLQGKIDSLKVLKGTERLKIYPFNPNFISDYKGYVLGMSVSEIDRLHKFRSKNQYVNSAEDFQKVTGVSDELLAKISPNFKFPDWVKHKAKGFNQTAFYKKNIAMKSKIKILDINQASKEDLMEIYGIGEGLSARILKEKEKFGAFVSMDQMGDVWGLSAEVIGKLNEHFKILSAPQVKKISINSLSMKELQQFPYFRYPLAKEIVTFRSMNGQINSKEDLIKIKNFPVEKVDIIALYLDF